MADASLRADSALDNRPVFNRDSMPQELRSHIHDCVMRLEELATRSEALAALVWMVARYDDFDTFEQRALDALQEHAGSVASALLKFSDSFGASFGYDTGDGASPVHDMQDRAKHACAATG